MTYMEYAQVEIENNGSTDTRYESCGSDACNHKILAALGIGEERLTDADTFDLSDIENQVIVRLIHHLDEQDSCTWCYGCGCFLVHGLSCGCAEWGFDPERDREPFEPLVDTTGRLELRPYPEGTAA